MFLQAEGSILAFYNPKFASKGPGGSSSSNSGLAVSQPHQVELLATSLSWGICKGKTKTGARCNNAVDTTVSCYCQYHALQQAKTLKKPATAAAGAVGRRGFSGLGGVRAGLGISGAGAAAAGDDGGGSAPVVAGKPPCMTPCDRSEHPTEGAHGCTPCCGRHHNVCHRQWVVSKDDSLAV